MTLRFRNLDVSPEAPVEEWPTEGFIAALERGSLPDWRRIVRAVRDEPWGPVARRLEDALATTQPYGTGVLMSRALEQARAEAVRREREAVAARVRSLFELSGLDRRSFAAAIGTSTSRLSTYLNGRVAPSSTLLVRMEGVARRAAEPDP